MADTNQGQNVPETKTQGSTMSIEEQKTPVEEGQQQVGEDVKPVSSEQPTSQGLPEDAKERTRIEFEKMETRYKEEKAARQRMEEIFKSITMPQQPVQQVAPQTPPLYDPETGLLNEEVLNQTQRQAQEAVARATRAEALATQYQQDQEAREAYQAYPELDPQGRFGKAHNKDFLVSARRILIDALLNPADYGGRKLSMKEAADIARSYEPKTKVEEVKKQAKQEGVKEAIEGLAPKEQASLEAEGATKLLTLEEEQDLAFLTRKGGRQGEAALAARISQFRKQSKS